MLLVKEGTVKVSRRTQRDLLCRTGIEAISSSVKSSWENESGEKQTISNPPYLACDTRPVTHLQALVAQRRRSAGLLPDPSSQSVAAHSHLLNLVAVKRLSVADTIVRSYQRDVVFYSIGSWNVTRPGSSDIRRTPSTQNLRVSHTVSAMLAQMAIFTL